MPDFFATVSNILAYVIWLDCGEEVGLLRIQRALEQCQNERDKHEKTRGLNIGPSMRERNLSRLIEMYKTINPNDPKDWPRPPRTRTDRKGGQRE